MKYILMCGVALSIISCNTSSNNQTLEVGSQDYQDSVIQNTTINNNNEAAKTDSEVMEEAGTFLVEQAKEMTAAKRKNDSIKLSTRGSVWVYQIGLPKNSEEELWAVYDRVKGFGNVSAFKQSRNSYILVKNDFYNKQQLEDSLSHFNTLLNAVGITDPAKPYDLMTDCKVKEAVVHTDDIKVKRKQVIPCLVCD